MSRKKVSAETDLKVLEALAMGIPSKEIVKMYGVSMSHISRLRTGKKTPNIYISKPEHIQTDFFEVYSNNLDEVINFIQDKELIVDKKDIIEYIEVKMKKHLVKAKMYQEILRRITNGIR